MPIYLNDLGITSALGNSKAEVIDQLLKNSQTNLKHYDHLFSERKTYHAEVNADLSSQEGILAHYNCRNNRMLIATYAQIKPYVESLKVRYGINRIGVVLGTSTSGILEGEKAFDAYVKSSQYPSNFDYRQQEIGQMALFLSEYAGLKGPSYIVSTACSSSAKAIISARRLIESGLCDAVIAGGCDSLCQMTLNGFDALEQVSDKICNPFSQNRNGITIGEGCALFVLSYIPSEIVLAGSGESSDAYHITSPDPSGYGAELAMSAALKSAKLKASDIGYLNAHGTATKKNDQMETKAIYKLFGNEVPVTSTKPLTGHTLGASASIELGLCWLLLSEKYNPTGLLPRQLWDGVIGEDIAPCMILNHSSCYEKNYFLSNSFAFGGNNTSLIIGKL